MSLDSYLGVGDVVRRSSVSEVGGANCADVNTNWEKPLTTLHPDQQTYKIRAATDVLL